MLIYVKINIKEYLRPTLIFYNIYEDLLGSLQLLLEKKKKKNNIITSSSNDLCMT